MDDKMGRLWAPWRVKFILGPKTPGCFLCSSAAEDRDAENHLLERGGLCFAILNRYPYNNGHLMISPYRHVGDLGALETEELTEIMLMTRDWVETLRESMQPQGFNVGFNLGAAAGAGVADHIHMHAVPRWDGDTNFMLVLGDVRVVNQSLDECFELLRHTRHALRQAGRQASPAEGAQAQSDGRGA